MHSLPVTSTFTCFVTSRATELRLALAVFGLLAVLFVAFPQLDLAISALFYRGDGEWVMSRGDLLLAIPYRALPRLGQLLLITLLALWLLSFVRRFPSLRARRHLFGFLLASAIAGPVLLVDVVMKDNIGRMRPVHIQEFGGTQQFTSAFDLGGDCRHNCAFVSGHVATASFIMAFGWLGAPAARRRWLLASLAFGGALTLVRIVPGAHFVSDGIFAWFATYFSLWATEWLFRRIGWLGDSD